MTAQRKATLAPSIALAAVLLSASANASTPIAVSIHDCPYVASELERLVQLELSTVLAVDRASSYQVDLVCSDGSIHMRIADPLTSKTLERTVRAPPRSVVELERRVALGVAQLYRTAWLELLTNDPPPLVVASPGPSQPAAMHAARSVVAATLSSPVSTWTTMLVVQGGVAVRGVGNHSMVMPSINLTARWSVRPKTWIAAGGRFEQATSERGGGDVRAVLAGGWLGLGGEPWRRGPWAAFVQASGGVDYLALHGERVAPGLVAKRVAGPGFDGSLALGLGVDVSPVRFELAAHAGALIGAPQGRVADDAPVSAGGFWFGACLGAGLTL